MQEIFLNILANCSKSGFDRLGEWLPRLGGNYLSPKNRA
jgi:hypothetical protein